MPKVELIAELSSNPGGNVELACAFVRAFAQAGADWIKVQTTRVVHLSESDPQYEWFKTAELDEDAHRTIKAACEKHKVKFLTTIYHPDEAAFVKSLGCDTVKIGSGEAGDLGLAAAVSACKFKRVIVGCGLMPPQKTAFGWLARYGTRVDFLRCVTRYPCAPALALGTYGHTYAGWSDHAIGLEACQIAIAKGARIIEKHVCLPNQARPVKPFEASPEQFAELRAMADDDPIRRFVGRWSA